MDPVGVVLGAATMAITGVVAWRIRVNDRRRRDADRVPRETFAQRYEHANRIADQQLADGYRDNYRRIGGDQ